MNIATTHTATHTLMGERHRFSHMDMGMHVYVTEGHIHRHYMDLMYEHRCAHRHKLTYGHIHCTCGLYIEPPTGT